MQSKGQRHWFNRINLSSSAAYLFFSSYFLNNILLQEGVRAYWNEVFNLLFAPYPATPAKCTFVIFDNVHLFIVPLCTISIISMFINYSIVTS